MDRDACNAFRFRADGSGHYESYFQRANHPTRKLGFWIRYTVFEPRGRPADAVAELWAIWFDGEAGRIVPVKSVVPIARSRFAASGLGATIDESTLDASSLRGRASAAGHTIRWSLDYTSREPPLPLLPDLLYRTPLPKAKLLVGSPLARFTGEIEVDGVAIPIDDWLGSQNHNWGSKHTDEYAWGQVAGFDAEPASFLELATARIHLGPLRAPWLTPIVLRHAGREYRFDELTTSVRADASYEPFTWRFASSAGGHRIAGRIEAPATDFVGLAYDNPPGGRKVCLNSKVARCVVRLVPAGGAPIDLVSERRAAFEILQDSPHPAVPMLEV